MTKITICGDFTTCGQGWDSVKKGTAIHNNVLDIIRNSDISILNLESPVAEPNDKKILKSGPNLRTSIETVAYLKECGFTHVTLANNHFYDYGDSGVTRTIDALKKEEIGYVGGGRYPEERRKPLYIDTPEGKIAILNYCEHEFSVHEPMGSNPMNPVAIYHDIQNAKNTCKFIIMICHGGHEGYQLPSPRMKELYHFFIDMGADIVCNHHQHCFSGWEEYNGGKIYYGLGNFFFDDHRPPRRKDKSWNFGFMLHIELVNHQLNCEPIPYSQCLDTKDCRLLKGGEYLSFINKISELSKIIESPNLLQTNFEMYCQRLKKNTTTELSPFANKYLKALCRRNLLPSFLNKKKSIELYNLIRCESLRDVAINTLLNI